MNVAICDHKDRELIEDLSEVLTSRGHTVLQVIADAPGDAFAAIRDSEVQPDVVVADFVYESIDFTRAVEKRWGALLIDLLKNDAKTSEMRIIVLSRFLTPDVREYLATVGLAEEDVIDPHTTTFKERAQLIDGMP